MPKNNLNVLVVDPESFTRIELAEMLAKAVTTVRAVRTGQEALAECRERLPDILIAETLLPDMDGVTFLEALRKTSDQLPVLLLFDGYNPSAIIKSLEYNVSGFLKKPVEKEQLYQQVWRVAKEVLLRQKLYETKSMFERILDVFPGHVALVERGSVTYLNSKLLNYLGFENGLELRESGLSFESFIKTVHGTSYDREQGSWSEQIAHDPLDREHLVSLVNPRHPADEGRVFAVEFTEVKTPGVYLFVFTDVSDLQKEHSTFADQASTDPLTGAFNRRRFLEILALKEMQLSTLGTPVSMIMFDIDHFKRVNDTYGHDAGDLVLKEICAVARGRAREGDHLGRWGGEEFMILLSGADLRQARALAERLRSQVESHDFSGIPGSITSSFGVGQWQQCEPRDVFLKRLDKALYAAKEGGRNRVVTA